MKVYLERKGELPKGLVLGLAAIITYYKGYVRADGTKSEPNDSAEILQLLQNLWATGSTRQVAEGVLAATSIWGEDLNRIPFSSMASRKPFTILVNPGMLNVVKEIC